MHSGRRSWYGLCLHFLYHFFLSRASWPFKRRWKTKVHESESASADMLLSLLLGQLRAPWKRKWWKWKRKCDFDSWVRAFFSSWNSTLGSKSNIFFHFLKKMKLIGLCGHYFLVFFCLSARLWPINISFFIYYFLVNDRPHNILFFY